MIRGIIGLVEKQVICMCMMPNGIADYKDLILQYVYIDKTQYIEKLEKIGKKTVHFLRPRRFGKTLFTSTLQYYYDVYAKDDFDTLFKDTYIGKHPTKEKNSYHILRFDFSGLRSDTTDILMQGFHNRN